MEDDIGKENRREGIPPEKSRVPLFNLLKRGSGIRYSAPGRKKGAGGPSADLLFAAFISLAVFTVALWHINTSPVAPPVPPINIVRPVPPPLREEPVVADTPILAEPVPTAEISPPAGTRIRFGVFTMKENAQRLVNELSRKGIDARVMEQRSSMPAYFIKTGPAKNEVELGNMEKEMKKIDVAPYVVIEAKYVNAGPIWLKDRALGAEKRLREAGLAVKVEKAMMERDAFKVLSAPFKNIDAAKRAMEEWKKSGVEGMVNE